MSQLRIWRDLSDSFTLNGVYHEKEKAMQQRIVVIEDEPSIAENIVYALQTDGYTVESCSTGTDGLAAIRSNPPALVILDIGLPDGSGFQHFLEIRKITNIPVIFLTARMAETDKVAGLEMGADDYVVKPFSPRELSARVRAVLRRTNSSAPASTASQPQGFRIDTDRFQILFHETDLGLSRYEFRLMKVLLSSQGRVYTREHLLELCWEEPGMSLERTVDAHVKTIRAKLRDAGADPEIIVTHRGLGYSLRTDSD